jgi:hypothetical protein
MGWQCGRRRFAGSYLVAVMAIIVDQPIINAPFEDPAQASDR